jgi:hypothetical protein
LFSLLSGYVSLAAFQEQFHTFNVDAHPLDIKKLFRSLDCGRDGVMDYEEWSKSVGFHALSERDLFQVANRKTFPAVSDTKLDTIVTNCLFIIFLTHTLSVQRSYSLCR